MREGSVGMADFVIHSFGKDKGSTREGMSDLVKDSYGNGQRSTCVGNVHDSGETAFTRAAGQQQVDLRLGVAKFGNVVDAVEHSALVRHCRI
jgi:hypothetical protein